MTDLTELQKAIDEAEYAFLLIKSLRNAVREDCPIIKESYREVYESVVKARDDYNEERSRQDIALRANTEGVGEVFSLNP